MTLLRTERQLNVVGEGERRKRREKGKDGERKKDMRGEDQSQAVAYVPCLADRRTYFVVEETHLDTSGVAVESHVEEI